MGTDPTSNEERQREMLAWWDYVVAYIDREFPWKPHAEPAPKPIPLIDFDEPAPDPLIESPRTFWE